MKIAHRFVLLSLAALLSGAGFCHAQSPDDPNEGSRLSLDAASGTFTFSWWGRAGITYFLQHSEDLFAWDYVPLIESGTDEVIEWGFPLSAERGFYRLRISDQPTNNPFTADFDGDHVSNWQELLHGTDPLQAADTDEDGFSNDWEIACGRDRQVADDPDSDDDGDGLSLAAEYHLGTDPGEEDTDDDDVNNLADQFPTDGRRSESIPIRYYGAIDLTEGLENFPPVQTLALDDNNQVAFAGWTAEQAKVAVWAEGTLTSQFSVTLRDSGRTRTPGAVNASGALFGGQANLDDEGWPVSGSGFIARASGVSNFTVPDEYSEGGNFVHISITLASASGAIMGQARASNGAADFAGMPGSLHLFDSRLGDPNFLPWTLSPSGVCVGFKYDDLGGPAGAYMIEGAALTYLGTLGASYLEPYAVNDQRQVVGWAVAYDSHDYPLGFFYTPATGPDPASTQNFHDLLPAKYRKQLRSAIPYLITNVDAVTNQPTIVFRAESLEGESEGDWIVRTLALEWKPGEGEAPPEPVVRVADVLQPLQSDGTPAPPIDFHPTQLNTTGLLAQAGPIIIGSRQIKAALFNGLEFTTSDITKGFDYPLPNDPPKQHGVLGPFTDEQKPEWWTSVGQGYLLGYGLNTRTHVNADIGSDPAAAWFGIRVKPEDTSLIELAPAELIGKETPLTIRGNLMPGVTRYLAQVEITDKADPPNVVRTLNVASFVEWEIPVRICYVYDGRDGKTDEPGNLTRIYDEFRITDDIIDQLNETFGQACVQFYAHPSSGPVRVDYDVGFPNSLGTIINDDNECVDTWGDLDDPEMVPFRDGGFNRTIPTVFVVREFAVPGTINKNVAGIRLLENETRTRWTMINQKLLEPITFSGPEWEEKRRTYLAVICHELGHVLGISTRNFGAPGRFYQQGHDNGAIPERYHARPLMYSGWKERPNDPEPWKLWIRWEDWEVANEGARLISRSLTP